jgi:hypothetical protein
MAKGVVLPLVVENTATTQGGTITRPLSSWLRATITATIPLTERSRGLQLQIPGWPGSLPGQHVDIRLTAPLDIEDLLEIAHREAPRQLTDDECRLYLHIDQCPRGGGSAP